MQKVKETNIKDRREYYVLYFIFFHYFISVAINLNKFTKKFILPNQMLLEYRELFLNNDILQ